MRSTISGNAKGHLEAFSGIFVLILITILPIISNFMKEEIIISKMIINTKLTKNMSLAIGPMHIVVITRPKKELIFHPSI